MQLKSNKKKKKGKRGKILINKCWILTFCRECMIARNSEYVNHRKRENVFKCAREREKERMYVKTTMRTERKLPMNTFTGIKERTCHC